MFLLLLMQKQEIVNARVADNIKGKRKMKFSFFATELVRRKNSEISTQAFQFFLFHNEKQWKQR
jgi:hypothetical protein